MPADPTPPPGPAKALEAAIEDFFLFAEPRYAPFDELVKARLTIAIKAVAADLVAAGRTAAAADLDAEAARMRRDDFRAGKVGIEYINGWEDAAARIAEEGRTDG